MIGHLSANGRPRGTLACIEALRRRLVELRRNARRVVLVE